MHYADGKLKSRHRRPTVKIKVVRPSRPRDPCGPPAPVEKGEKIASGIRNERNFDHQTKELREKEREGNERRDTEVGRRGRGMPTPPHLDSINHNSV